MNYHFEYHIDHSGYWGQCLEVHDCYTQGKTKEEFEKNCKESLNLMLEEPEDSAVVFPLPKKSFDSKKNVISVSVEPEIAFGVILKNYRIAHKITQKQAAELLGMKNIYSYQRLEKKSNPTLLIINKICTVFPGIKIDLAIQ